MNNGDIMILETIAQANRERYAEIEKQIPLEEIKSKALSMNITDEFPFEKALAVINAVKNAGEVDAL